MNQREIKFRAWAKEEKFKSFNGEIKRMFSWEDINHYSLGWCFNWWENEDFELMQFTGLLDKNGKEIYENDVIQWSDGVSQEVVWNDKMACFSLKESKVEMEGVVMSVPLGLLKTELIEVIGNVYENKKGNYPLTTG